MADASVFLLRSYSGDVHVNVGLGEDVAIAELMVLVCNIVGSQGELRFDRSRLDGTMRKLMDSSRLRAMGWLRKIALRQGIEAVYAIFSRGGVQAQRQRGSMDS